MLKRRIFVLASVAFVAGFLVYRSNGFGAIKNFAALPSFSFPDTQGVVHKIDEWKGKVLVINFWATWCAPCLEEIPRFMEFQDRYRSRGLQFIGIAVDEPEPVAEYSKRIGINFPSLVSGMSGFALSSELGNPAGVVPFSVVVNREGQIVYEHAGLFHPEQIEESVLPLL